MSNMTWRDVLTVAGSALGGLALYGRARVRKKSDRDGRGQLKQRSEGKEVRRDVSGDLNNERIVALPKMVPGGTFLSLRVRLNQRLIGPTDEGVGGKRSSGRRIRILD